MNDQEIGWRRYMNKWPPGMFLSELPTNAVEALLASGEERQYRPGEILMRQNDPGNSVAALLDGVVRVSTAPESAKKKEPLLQDVRGSGDILGEGALAPAGRRSATVVVAHRPASVVRVTYGQLKKVAIEHPDLYWQITTAIADKLAAQMRRRSEIWSAETEVRLARILVELVERLSDPSDPGYVLDVGLTQADLGSLIGIGRNLVNQHLGELQEQGILEHHRMKTTVFDMLALRRIARSGTETSAPARAQP
ncbi:Crp/Fnr family transcriptional regulator [Actinomadura adrarensis]|uniref:Crp/Fnr family transcriptional regulator n=1 Tax=Actinomadura adrarensis TaxID=1819600 RepID=A0ABW3CV85_9ACTN